jgi:hypothetical protein
MIIYLFLRLDALKLVEYVALLLVCAIMMLTKAQSDIMCGFLLMAGILVYRLTRKWHRKKVFRVLGSVMSFSYIICAAAIFIITLGFDRNNKELRKKLQYSLIRRLEMNQEALREHPFSFFGSTIEEHGFGGRTENLPGWDKYFFIDCSYIRLFVIGGVLLFLLILMAMTYAQIRCYAYKNYGFVFLLALVAVACIMEHHLMEYYYNVFPMIAFAGKDFLRPPHRKKPVVEDPDREAAEDIWNMAETMPDSEDFGIFAESEYKTDGQSSGAFLEAGDLSEDKE